MKTTQLPKIIISVVVFLCLALIGQSQSGENLSQISQQNKTIQISTGEYLRSDYIEMLDKTLSPLKAYVYDTTQMAIAKKDKQGISLTIVFNFHEGGASLILRNNGSVVVEQSGGADFSNLVMKVIDSKTFKLGFDKYKPKNYIFVGNAEKYVANRVISGEYKDSKGQVYVFGKDGRAIFPERKFKYEIGLDFVETPKAPYDYLMDRTANKIYVFKRYDDTLELFNTSGEFGEIVEKEPFLVLKKIKNLK